MGISFSGCAEWVGPVSRAGEGSPVARGSLPPKVADTFAAEEFTVDDMPLLRQIVQLCPARAGANGPEGGAESKCQYGLFFFGIPLVVHVLFGMGSGFNVRSVLSNASGWGCPLAGISIGSNRKSQCVLWKWAWLEGAMVEKHPDVHHCMAMEIPCSSERARD